MQLPTTRMITGSHRTVLLMSILLALVPGACDETRIPTANQRSPHAYAEVLTPPVSDLTMGEYSSVARHIVIALQDSSMRRLLFDSLHARAGGGVLIDLTNCSTGLSAQILAAGEHRGAGSASPICKTMQSGNGAVLYVNAQSVAAWGPNSIPVVTAISDLSAPVPLKLKGYRSPSRMIDIPFDSASFGPVLIVLPMLHPNRLASVNRRAQPLTRLTGPAVLPPLGKLGTSPQRPLRQP